MEHTFPSESSQQENRRSSVYSGREVPFIPEIFQWNEPKTCVPFTSQLELPEFLGKWKTPFVLDVKIGNASNSVHLFLDISEEQIKIAPECNIEP